METMDDATYERIMRSICSTCHKTIAECDCDEEFIMAMHDAEDEPTQEDERTW